MLQNNILATRLAAARKENNYTQEEIAEFLNCGRATITNYESGRRSPDYDTLIKLSKKYNVTTDYLLGLTGAETSDKDIRYICDYTNLNEQTVDVLHNSESVFSKFINYFLSEEENMIAFVTLITSFNLYRSWIVEMVDFKKKMLESNNNIEPDKIVECVNKDDYLNEKINVTEFKIHKQITELLNLYTKIEKEDDEQYKKDYDYLLICLQNKALDIIENNLVKGCGDNVND